MTAETLRANIEGSLEVHDRLIPVCLPAMTQGGGGASLCLPGRPQSNLLRKRWQRG